MNVLFPEKCAERKIKLSSKYKLIISAALAVLLDSSDSDTDPDEVDVNQRRRRLRVIRRRIVFDDHVRVTIADGSFRRMYRMDFPSFLALVDKLRPHLTRDTQKAARVGEEVTCESQVAICLRFLAGASYLDVQCVHGVSRATIYEVVSRVVTAISERRDIGAVQWPVTPAEYFTAASAFKQLSTMGCIENCVGALDGLFVEIKCPSSRDHASAKRFFSGNKVGYGLNVQGVCDARCRFIGASCNTPGGTNDVVAWNLSAMSIEDILYPYFIVVDAVFFFAYSDCGKGARKEGRCLQFLPFATQNYSRASVRATCWSLGNSLETSQV